MNRKLSPKEIIYNIKLDENDFSIEDHIFRDINKYDDLKKAIQIKNKGYNLYIIDEFNNQKKEELKRYINEILQNKNAPNDICYISDQNEYSHTVTLNNGSGKIFVSSINEIQEYYSDLVFNFYNKDICEEKEKSLEYIEKERIKMLDDLLVLSKNKGFAMKIIDKGFTFIPIKDDSEMTEEEYENLSEKEKTQILNNISELKSYSKETFKALNDIEIGITSKLKLIFSQYIKKRTFPIKNKYAQIFCDNELAIKFLNDMCIYIENSIIDNFNVSYEDYKEKINNIINKFKVNLIVDNSNNKKPICIFEEDPTMDNLIGKIEYESNNGTYSTNVTLIKAGSLLKANEGCLIINANDILSNKLSYYYLKKCLLNGAVNINYNAHYFDILSLNGVELDFIPINTKIIFIGDYEIYSLLYRYDRDFKKLFKLKIECDPLMKINKDSKKMFIQNIDNIRKYNNIKKIEDSAINELFKYSSRIAENKNKIYLNDDIEEVIILSNLNSDKKNKQYIDKDDVIEVINENKQDVIEKYIMDNYIENKQFIKLKGEVVGQINGLSVIDVGYSKFGKPIRITCSCYYGNGNIFDVQNESNLGGNIYKKAVNILKGCMSNLVGQYSRPCVDFHVSFEQLYGSIDGDSASVAEIIAMISALCKVPIKQNIAITGSIDQFGEVQPVGGINEKIEGFYKVCKNIDKVSHKGVIIPNSNVNNIILNRDVEKSVTNGEFCIYAIDNIFDAIEILMGKGKDQIVGIMHSELKKYSKTKKN